MKVLLITLVLAGIGLGAWGWMSSRGVSVALETTKPQAKLESAIKKWMHLHVADKDSEIIMIATPAVCYDGRFYRVVINEFVAVGQEQNSIDKLMTPKEMVASFGMEKRTMQELDALRELSATLQKVAETTLKKQGG